tara:strand:+ start:409 stop:537 length:129 start_codon:yes stop_codon:yes gene_type:complete
MCDQRINKTGSSGLPPTKAPKVIIKANFLTCPRSLLHFVSRF